MKTKTVGSFLFLLSIAVLFQLSLPAGSDAAEKPWSKYSFQLGGFFASNNSSVRFGAGTGLEVSLEDALGLDVSTTAFRFDAHWRFTQNMRHKFDFSYYSIRRSGSRTVENEFTIEDPTDPDGPPIVIEAGAQIDSFLDLDILKASYSYSFFQDERVDFSGNAGLFIMPISTGFTATGVVNEKADASFTAPLPVLGIEFNFALTPKWFFKTGTQLFYLEYENYKGSLFRGSTTFEYRAWEHVAFGFGTEMLRINVEAEDEDIPGVDFRGTINMSYLSALLYIKAYF